MTNYWPVTSSSKYRACPIMRIMDSDKCFLAFLPPISCFFSIFHFGNDNVNWNTIWIFIYSHALMAACVQEIVYIDCGFGADPYPILFSSPWFKSYLQQRGISNKNDCFWHISMVENLTSILRGLCHPQILNLNGMFYLNETWWRPSGAINLMKARRRDYNEMLDIQ